MKETVLDAGLTTVVIISVVVALYLWGQRQGREWHARRSGRTFDDGGHMSASGNLDWFALESLYYEGCRLFMRGDYDHAIDQFKRIYEENTDLWDVAEVVEGYYALPRDQWISKHRPRIETRLLPSKRVERMAAGGLFRRLRMRLAAVMAHFFRWAV